MHALAFVLVRGQAVRLVVVQDVVGAPLLLRLLLGAQRVRLLVVFALVGGLLFDRVLAAVEGLGLGRARLQAFEAGVQVRVAHEALVFERYFVGRLADHAVGVVADPDEDRAEQNADVEAVAFLPLDDGGGAGDVVGELERVFERLVEDEVGDVGCALLEVVELEVAHFGGPDGRRNELLDLALVLGAEEQLPA